MKQLSDSMAFKTPFTLTGLCLLLLLTACASPSGQSPTDAFSATPLIVRTTDSSGQLGETRLVDPPTKTRSRRPITTSAPSESPASTDRHQTDDATGERIMLNFIDADLAGVVASLARFTGHNFLVDPRVKGQLTLVSESPVDARTANDMLLAALRMQGFAVVNVDGVHRVVPEADAKLQGGTVSSRIGDSQSADSSGAGIETRVFRLRYENAANLVSVLRPLIPPNNTITAYPGNNTLVISDYANNLDRIAKIIDRIDVAANFSTAVIPIDYGVALDVAALASQLLNPGNSSAIAVVADPRSNSVVVRAPNDAQLKLARDLILRIDSPQTSSGNLHVVYLRNAQATQLAEVLRGVLISQAAQLDNSGSGSAMSMLSGQGTTGAAQRQTSSQSDTSILNEGGQFDEEDKQVVSFAAGGATLQADPTTNTLIISAPDPVYRSLREVIDQLDQRRAQVLVESLIVEVTAANAAEFGLQWSAGGRHLGDNRTTFVGGANFGGAGLNPNNPLTTVDALARGLSLGVARGTVTILGNEVLNLGVLARALQTQAGVNILSTPNLTTLDNEEASIMVGRTVPFTTGRYITTGDGAGTNPFQTIEREDVGLTLKIRPQISEGGSVKMSLYQEVSSIDGPASEAAGGLVTRKRALDTKVLVDDGQIIVLGGLIEDSVSAGTESVPLLGDIPVLGHLFRYNTAERTKTNLMIFLRPHIMRNARDSASLTLDRYEYMRGTQQNLPSTDNWLLPDNTGKSILPEAFQRSSDGLIDLRSGEGVELPVKTTQHQVSGTDTQTVPVQPADEP